MKYVHLNNENKILGFYDKKIHKIIPEPNIEITNEVWQDCIANQYNYYNGETKKFERKDFRTEKEKQEDQIRKDKYEGKEYTLNRGSS